MKLMLSISIEGKGKKFTIIEMIEVECKPVIGETIKLTTTVGTKGKYTNTQLIERFLMSHTNLSVGVRNTRTSPITRLIRTTIVRPAYS